MRFRNAFRIVMNNFGNVYKLLLFRLVTNVIFLSLSYVVITLGLHVILGSEEAHTILELVGEFFKALTGGDTAFLAGFSEEFTQAIADFLVLLGKNIGSIVGSVVGVAALYLVSRFIGGTSMLAMGTIFNDKMETYGNTRFASAYFKNLTRRPSIISSMCLSASSMTSPLSSVAGSSFSMLPPSCRRGALSAYFWDLH